MPINVRILSFPEGDSVLYEQWNCNNLSETDEVLSIYQWNEMRPSLSESTCPMRVGVWIRAQSRIIPVSDL